MNTASTIYITFVAPKHVGLTHDAFNDASNQWPTGVMYRGKGYSLHSYENPIVDASLFTIFYRADDGEWLAVDYEGSGFENLQGPYVPERVDYKQVRGEDYGVKISFEDLSWQDSTITLDGGRAQPRSVTYAPRSYRWLISGILYSAFFQSESSSYEDEIPDLEVLA